VKVGDKVRWRNRRDDNLAFLVMGDVVMEVVRKHPILADMWLLRGPDNHEDWIHAREVWVLK
jgi:hypothetical protein